MLGGIVVERQQLLEVVGDLRDRLGELGAVGGFERSDSSEGVRLVFGVPDLGEGLLRAGMRRLRQRREDVAGLVEPAALLAGGRDEFAPRNPEPVRAIADRRIFPAVDVLKSGTRREELLFDENMYRQVLTMRRMVGVLGGTEGLELVLARLAKTKDNNEFLATLTKDIL